MPFFIKKSEEEEKHPEQEVINELSQGEAETQSETREKFIKKSTEHQKSATLPLGTITVSIFTNEIEFARFTIKPELFSESAELIKNLISNINKPQLKITSNCNCIWCQQKSKELEEFLLE